MNNFYFLDSNYIKYIESLGVNIELVFKKASIPPKAMRESGLSLNKEQYIQLMESLDRNIPDDLITKIGDIDNFMMFAPPLFAAMCSKDGASCFERLSKYKKLIGPFILVVNQDEMELRMEFIFNDEEKPIPRFTIFTEQVLLVSLVRKATGLHIIPSKVESIYRSSDVIEEFLGIKPVKSECNMLTFNIQDMKEPFLTQNNTMWSYLEPELIKRMKELEIDNSFSTQVRSILFELIPAGEDNIDAVSKELAVSSRTLQRKLAAENTTFIKQLNQTRELLAKNYLKDKAITNDDIAFLIGYSDANAFTRAFRSWTGMTAGEYRKNQDGSNGTYVRA